jgi:predicted small lipoprotein YifL
MRPPLQNLLLAAGLALALSGCGIKGGLDKPQASAPDTTADADSAQGKAEGEAGKPHKGFILDGILR